MAFHIYQHSRNQGRPTAALLAVVDIDDSLGIFLMKRAIVFRS